MIQLHDPHATLGAHAENGGVVVRAFRPDAQRVVVRPHGVELDRGGGEGLFEGEPARSVPERRRKTSPLRDVAGMLRSFAYAASAATIQRSVDPPKGWEDRCRTEFLDGYLDTAEPSLLPSSRDQIARLLMVFELEKAVYELRYELHNRPDWVAIPVAGILRMLEQP